MKNAKEIVQSQLTQQKARLDYLKEILAPNMKFMTASNQKSVECVLKDKFFEAADHLKESQSFLNESMMLMAQIAELNEQLQQLEFRSKVQ